MTENCFPRSRSAGFFALPITCLVAIFGMLAACSAKGEEAKDAPIPLVQGSTDERMFKALSQLIADGHKKFRIKSSGGEEAVAIKIATLLHENKIELIVEDFCTSSCAQYLMAGAKSTEVSPGTLIGVHMNSYGLVIGGYVAPSEPHFALLQKNTEAARNLYQKAGRDPEFMTLATESSELKCTIYEGGVPKRAFARYQTWVPTKEILAEHGFKIKGELPNTRQQAAQNVRRYRPDGYTFWFGPVPERDTVKPLRNCEELSEKL